ncbi:MAG: MFS transporter [Phycisphaeraceae bacterium]|nr:MAG: MFS transporter [Phycisphaeraceae bacterium]
MAGGASETEPGGGEGGPGVRAGLGHRRWWVLGAHVAGSSLVQAPLMASVFMLPVVARKHFGAGDWETLAITALPNAMFVTSIFWNGLLERWRTGPFLLVYWVCVGGPMLATSGVTSLWAVLALHAVLSVGVSGYIPVSGDLLRRLYPEKARGRVYAVLLGANMVALAAATRAVGAWLDRDPEAFRVYMPLAGVMALAGCGVLGALSGLGGGRGPRGRSERVSWRGVVSPVLHMREVLRGDPVFARYEGAFMTYGVGWMICAALLPILATDRLGLTYDQTGSSTQVAYAWAIVAALAPFGLLIDRIGPIRTSGLAFLGLSAYPIGLMLADGPLGLTAASVAYGIAHAGVSVGWMVGPVSLAPTREKAGQYAAIHATLVGVRGALFQFLGVWLYQLTGTFAWPLGLAAVSFVWAWRQMGALDRRVRSPGS